MNALLICSQAGLEPDGRLAHLIPFKDQVQVIFDYKGLVTLALRNGASSVFADKVCANDFFEAGVIEGRKSLTHRPTWKEDRGEPYCYYAVCKRGDEIDWEVMSRKEVDAIRGRSRAGSNGPWVTDYDEMAKKTVLRRMSKRWDLLPEIRDVVNADDDTPDGSQPFARPLFDQKPLLDVTAQPPAEPAPEPPPASSANAEYIPGEEEQAEAAAGLAPAAAAQAEPPPPEPGFNAVRSVRNLCKIAKLSESVLVGYLAEIGATDGSCATLEEIQLGNADLLKQVSEHWTDHLTRIKTFGKK
jgi:recombination protein RecT